MYPAVRAGSIEGHMTFDRPEVLSDPDFRAIISDRCERSVRVYVNAF